MDYENPTSAELAISGLSQQGIQAQMAKVSYQVSMIPPYYISSILFTTLLFNIVVTYEC